MTRVYDGKDLAKVLIYYGIIGDVTVSEFNIVCPFHDDINPSMRIKLTDGTFYCFGCEATGNAYDFVKKVHPELNDIQALVVLEKILKSNEIKKLEIKYRTKRRMQNGQALIEAKDYYYGLRTTDWNNPTNREEKQVLEYMKQRGFDARALNIARCKSSYSVAYPILFPIFDNGSFKGWVARTTNKYVERKRKYLYNEGFSKRNTICGAYENGKIVFLCEGYMDYLSLRTRGHLKNVCAILGWHISDEQVKKLKDANVHTVVSVLDNDKCGNKGTEYLKNFFEVIRFDYPVERKDPGEMTEEEIVNALSRTKQKIGV